MGKAHMHLLQTRTLGSMTWYSHCGQKNLLFIVGIITKKWAGYLFKTRMGAGICGGACGYPSRL